MELGSRAQSNVWPTVQDSLHLREKERGWCGSGGGGGGSEEEEEEGEEEGGGLNEERGKREGRKEEGKRGVGE